jgi:hypothetical protein
MVFIADHVTLSPLSFDSKVPSDSIVATGSLVASDVKKSIVTTSPGFARCGSRALLDSIVKPVIVGTVASNLTDDASLVVVKFSPGIFPARSFKDALVSKNGMAIWLSLAYIVLVAV